MIVSAPARRLPTNVVTEVTITSKSPARRACMAMGLELMPMISASTPSFLSSPFSWTTHIGLAAGLSAAHAILVFSCASAENHGKAKTLAQTIARRCLMPLRMIGSLKNFS